MEPEQIDAPAEDTAQDDTPDLPPAVRESLAREADEGAGGTAQGAPAEMTIADPPPEEPEQGAVDEELDQQIAALHELEGRQQRVQQPQNPMSDPRLLAQVIQQAVDSSPQARAVARALQQSEQQQVRARAPQPPGDGSTAADWAQYSAAAVEFSNQQLMGQFQQALGPIQQQLQAQQQAQQQQFRQARESQRLQALDGALQSYAQRPDNAWLANPVVMAVARSVYEQARQNDPRITLPGVIKEMGAAFGSAFGRPAPAAVSQQRRQASTQDLAQRRAKVPTNAPIPGKGGKGNAKEGNVARLKRTGMWDAMPRDIQQLNELRDSGKFN